MKKKILGIMVVTAIAIFAGYNVYISQDSVNLSDLVLANVDALAQQGESGDSKVYCSGNSGTCLKIFDANGSYEVAGIKFTSPCQ